MNPLKRAARLVLWMIAAGLILIGGLNLSLEFIKHHLHQTEISLWRCAAWAVPVLLGAFLFSRSSALASHLTEDYDDTDES